MSLRAKFDLDKAELDGYTIHVHGGYGVGKTYLEGDFLKHESKVGEVRFINIAGEDGSLTMRGMGLGNVGETVDNYADFMEALKEFTAKKLQALAIDSSNALAVVLMRKVVGSDRLPEIKQGSNEWGEFHHLSRNTYTAIRRAARFVMVTCPSDKSTDQLSGKLSITPDLPGRQAAGSAGWFDFQGLLEVTHTASGPVRTFNLVPNNNAVVRQRLPKAITELIKLPNGPGGWECIKKSIEAGWK